MAASPSVPVPVSTETGDRRLIHVRRIELRGYQRADGLFELEAELTDLKAADFELLTGRVLPAGEPLHGMGLQMVFDADLRIHGFSATMRQSPYGGCHQAVPAFRQLAGLTIKPGFLREAQVRVAGVVGCTHLRELLQQLATTAYQTVVGERLLQPQPALAPGERPKLLDSCAGYRTDGEAVLTRWPSLYQPPG